MFFRFYFSPICIYLSYATAYSARKKSGVSKIRISRKTSQLFLFSHGCGRQALYPSNSIKDPGFLARCPKALVFCLKILSSKFQMYEIAQMTLKFLRWIIHIQCIYTAEVQIFIILVLSIVKLLLSKNARKYLLKS